MWTGFSGVAQLGVNVEKILLTHGHIDHAGGTAALARQLSVPIEGPEREDSFWIEALPQQSKMFGFPQVEAFTPDRWLVDGDVVDIGQEKLDVLHCPGHTPGMWCFQCRRAPAGVGDVLSPVRLAVPISRVAIMPCS